MDAEAARRLDRERLRIIEALVQAQDRRVEVLGMVAEAADDAEAQAAIAALLGLRGEDEALAVMEMQLRRMTSQGRDRLVRERDELRRRTQQ